MLPHAAKPLAWRPSNHSYVELTVTPCLSDVDLTSQAGEGIFDKLKGSMDKARMVGSRVVPHLSQNGGHRAQVSRCIQGFPFG